MLETTVLLCYILPPSIRRNFININHLTQGVRQHGKELFRRQNHIHLACHHLCCCRNNIFIIHVEPFYVENTAYY